VQSRNDTSTRGLLARTWLTTLMAASKGSGVKSHFYRRPARRARMRSSASGPLIQGVTSKSAMRRVGSHPCSPGRMSASASRNARCWWRPPSSGNSGGRGLPKPPPSSRFLGLACGDPVGRREREWDLAGVPPQGERPEAVEVLRLIYLQDPGFAADGEGQVDLTALTGASSRGRLPPPVSSA
jgi:hypothetical protein